VGARAHQIWSDGGRVAEIRCEPGVGGRVMEVLDDRSGDEVLERARITEWDPPVRLAWESSLDDVATEVRFEPITGGTRVVVEHRIPEAGEDRGGTAWSRVVPKWFGSWCERRDRVPQEQLDIARLSLGISYERPVAAAHWLADAFAFEPDGELPSADDALPHRDHGHPWIELRVGNSVIIVFALDGTHGAGGPTHVPWVYVDDLPAHFERAKGAGAEIVQEMHAFPSSMYVADDLEGNRWTFLQARPTMR
jgi:uncharacterized glyoxalase superfamily protein PhnB